MGKDGQVFLPDRLYLQLNYAILLIQFCSLRLL